MGLDILDSRTTQPRFSKMISICFYPPAELEKRKHKLQRLVQSPNSFMTVSPGTWLANLCPNRYDVRVKKSSKACGMLGLRP